MLKKGFSRSFRGLKAKICSFIESISQCSIVAQKFNKIINRQLMSYFLVMFSYKNKIMILAILGFLLFFKVSPSYLNVFCTTKDCPKTCDGSACITYRIQDVGYQFVKCASNCNGITSDMFDLQKCSGVTDSSNTRTCDNQCCYQHSLQRRKICLVPEAIGLVANEYNDVCTRASRDLFKEIDQMKIQQGGQRESASSNDDRTYNVAYAGLVVAVFGTVSGFILTLYFKCQKSETNHQKQPSNPETQRKLQSQKIQPTENQIEQVQSNLKEQNKPENSEINKPKGPNVGTKIVRLQKKKKQAI